MGILLDLARRSGKAETETIAPFQGAALGPCNMPVEGLPNPAAEARRQRVLEMLTQHPGARYAVVTDSESEADAVILALAVRGRATCEFRIPRDRYDGVLLLELIDRHSATVH